MRHPLRKLAGQGIWYAVSNVLAKLAGLLLLPLYANTTYLSVEAFGVWGVLELTVQLSVALIGLQLGASLLRFYPARADSGRVVSAVWWLTLLIGAAAAGIAYLAVRVLVGVEQQRLFMLLILYVETELMIAVPLALLRVRGQAFLYSVLGVVKLVLAVSLNLAFLAGLDRGLTGIVEAFLLANSVTLIFAIAATRLPTLVVKRFDRELTGLLIRFSAPLVLAGLGSMMLNAGDRYMLTLLSTEEQLAIYYMAAKFGSVVNMFGAQPLALAFLPLLFTLAASQREEVIRVLMRYLFVGFGLLVVCLSLFSGPVLDLLGADEAYQASVPLVPWVALGFAAFGISIPFEGILTLHRRTGTVSRWVLAAAAVNLLLNAVLIPPMEAAGAAVATFLSYAFLFWGRYHASRRLMIVPHALRHFIGIGAVTVAAALIGGALPELKGWEGLAARLGILLVWAGVIGGFRWFSLNDARDAWQVLRTRSVEEAVASNNVAPDKTDGNEADPDSS